jgi:hypothetical protein
LTASVRDGTLEVVKVAALVSLAAIVIVAAIPSTAGGAGGEYCRLLDRNDAADAMEQPAALFVEAERMGDAEKCTFRGGPREPDSIPPELRVVVTLELDFFLLNKENLKPFQSLQCKLANKGFYPQDACTFAKKAVKVDDPLERFKLAHRSLAETGDVSKRGGFGGNPAFLVQLDPKLVGTELWVYIEKKRKALVVTCANYNTIESANGHFPGCVDAAAHEAFEKISP